MKWYHFIGGEHFRVDAEKFLKEADIIAVADMLGVDVATVKAVNKVESAGSGFLKDGRTKILFERHIMHKYLKNKFSLAVANEQKAKLPDICNTATGGYKGGVAEYPRLAAAKTMDEECAEYEREHLPDITQKQLRLTLIKHGILPDQVEAKIAAIPDDEGNTH